MDEPAPIFGEQQLQLPMIVSGTCCISARRTLYVTSVTNIDCDRSFSVIIPLLLSFKATLPFAIKLTREFETYTNHATGIIS